MATVDPLAPVLDFIELGMQNPVIFIPSMAIVFTIIGAYLYKEKFLDEKFEGTPIAEDVDDKIDSVADLVAPDSKRKLIQGWEDVGKVSQVFTYSTVIKESSYDQIDDDENAELHIIKVRPPLRKIFGFIGWVLIDVFFQQKKFTKTVVVEDEYIEVGDVGKIDRDVEFSYRLNNYIQRSAAGNSFVMDLVYEAVLDNSLDTFSEIVELMNELNIDYVTETGKLEKELELREKHGKTDTLSKVNG